MSYPSDILLPRLLFYLIVLLLPFSKTNAQITTRTICDSLSRQPIPGTSVYALHHMMGTITDVNGHFELHISKQDTLVVDHLAYALMKISASEIKDTLWLQPKIFPVQETVIHSINPVQLQHTGKLRKRKYQRMYGQPLGCLGKVMKSEPVPANVQLTGLEILILDVMHAPVPYRLSVYFAQADRVRSRDSLWLIAYYDGQFHDSDSRSLHTFSLNTRFSPPNDGFLYTRLDILDTTIHSTRLDSIQQTTCKNISIGMERTRQEYYQVCSNYGWADNIWYSYNALGKFIEQKEGIPMENNTFMVRMRWKKMK